MFKRNFSQSLWLLLGLAGLCFMGGAICFYMDVGNGWRGLLSGGLIGWFFFASLMGEHFLRGRWRCAVLDALLGSIVALALLALNGGLGGQQVAVLLLIGAALGALCGRFKEHVF